jgi:vacuolar iron transporter family protein
MRDFEKGVEHSQLSKQRMHALEHSHTQEAIRARLARVPRSNFLRDWIYGGIDGAVTTFAIIAGVVGADLSTSVFLPTVLRWRQAATLAPKPSVMIMIASSALNAGASRSCQRANARKSDRFSPPRFCRRRPRANRRHRNLWAKTMAVEEYGLSPTPRSPVLAALSTLAAFIVCGLVPLATYLSAGRLVSCIVATGATFFGVGAIKSRWSPVSWWRSGLETLLIGMSAAAVAFAIGFGLRATASVPVP